jgi:hypothetical protein
MTWWAGAVIWKLENGLLYFLVQDARSTNPRWKAMGAETKFPGGNNELQDKDLFIETCRRELKAETYLELLAGNYESDRIYDRIIGGHRKIFYLINHNSLVGDLRTFPILDGDDTLEPPRWVLADHFLHMALHGKYHKQAFLEAFKRLTSQHSLVG